VLSAYTDIGFILKQVKYKEADKILFVFSLHHGLIELVAKGARKQTSRKSGHLDSINLIKFHVARSRYPQILTQVETLDSFSLNKSSLFHLRACFLISETLISLMAFEQTDVALFNSLKNYFKSLEKKDSLRQIQDLSNNFQSYIIRHLGFPKASSNTASGLITHLESIIDRPLLTPLFLTNLSQ